MSTFRNKALKFDAERKTKFGSTTSQFGKVGRNVDSESDKPKLAHETFVARPKVLQSDQPSTSKEIRNELSELAKDEEKPADKNDFVRKDPHPTVNKAPASTEDELITRHQPGGAFAKAWTTVDHIVIPQVIESRKSSYTPNYIMANAIVVGMERCLDENEELKWICPNYFSLPTRIYYAVVFYLQILKAKEAAGKLPRAEGSWYRSFKRVYPLESLPIAGPMVPYFSNIVSVLPNDDKYDFIFPTFNVNGGLSVEKGVPKVEDEFFLQPNVLLLTEMLREFCCQSMAALNAKNGDQGKSFNSDMILIPKTMGKKFNFAGIEYPETANIAVSQTLSNPAMDSGLPEVGDRYTKIHSYWRKSRCSGIPAADTSCKYDNLGDTLRMLDDFEWFEECISMASIQCKFFTDSVNLSQIPSTGGSEALITAHITGTNLKYAAPTEWYPENWVSLKASFQTTRADATPDQFMNATYALSNATISWTNHGHPVGGRQCGQRTGPYWSNKEFAFQSDSTVPVATRITTMIRSHFYDCRGNAS